MADLAAERGAEDLGHLGARQQFGSRRAVAAARVGPGVKQRGDGDASAVLVGWVAVRHDDPGVHQHVHIVATLARQNGRRAWPRNDYYRIGEASRAAERRYGLRATAPSDRTAAKAPTRAQTEKPPASAEARPTGTGYAGSCWPRRPAPGQRAGSSSEEPARLGGNAERGTMSEHGESSGRDPISANRILIWIPMPDPH